MKLSNRRVRVGWLLVWLASGALISGACRGVPAETLGAEGNGANAESKAPAAAPPPINPLDAQRAYDYLKQICAIGPRISGSEGMKKQQELVQAHFEKLGGNVSFQRFMAKNPRGGEPVPMANMIIEWHPERKQRILLVAHYDTRPLPDRDPDPVKRKSGTFLGANDGASGTALLMELGHFMKDFAGEIGVDFLLVDGEELVYKEGDPYFIGATRFSEQYVKNPPEHKYRWAVVLDMVADRDLQLYQEKFSATWRESRPLVRSIWSTAAKLGVREFIPRIGYDVQDDHLPLRNTAKIPSCDIIDFADPADRFPPSYWHTTGDTPLRCSGNSLAKVGWVVLEWLKSESLPKSPEPTKN